VEPGAPGPLTGARLTDRPVESASEAVVTFHTFQQMTDHASDHPPTAEQRRAAACLAMSKAPGLIRFAARYTRSLHDAEDAY